MLCAAVFNIKTERITANKHVNEYTHTLEDLCKILCESNRCVEGVSEAEKEGQRREMKQDEENKDEK